METSDKRKKISINRDLCIGCGSCGAIAPKTFEQDSDNKTIVKNPDRDDDETILTAAKTCPVKAIILYGENGEKIYP